MLIGLCAKVVCGVCLCYLVELGRVCLQHCCLLLEHVKHFLCYRDGETEDTRIHKNQD